MRQLNQVLSLETKSKTSKYLSPQKGLFSCLLILLVTLAGCDSSITNPEQKQQAEGLELKENRAYKNNNSNKETASLLNLFDPAAGAFGEVVMQRRPGNNTMSWRLKTSAFEAGNAYTVWVGNFDGTGLGNDGGWGAGGLVGGSGKLTASGNHCVWPLDPNDPSGLTGGFRPGVKSDCDMIDVSGPIFFFVLDHKEWEPGDMLARWDPTSGTGDLGVLGGVVFGSFPPLE